MIRTLPTYSSSNGARTRTRVCIGSICRDDHLFTDPLVFGGKNRIQRRLVTEGGGAGNVAVGHRRLAPKHRIILLAGTGNDPEGAALRQRMKEQRIEMPWPALAHTATSISSVLHCANGANGTILYDGNAREVPVPLPLIEQALPWAEACCLVAPTVSEQIPDILTLARRQRVPVFFGLGSRQIKGLTYIQLSDLLREPVELIICNRKEAQDLTGCRELPDQHEALTFAGRVRTVVITDGADALHGWRDGERCDVPAYVDPLRTVVDDTGAGDAAQAAVVHALLGGYPLEAALQAGARQGFECCTAVGAATCLLGGAALRDYLSLVAGAGIC